MRRLIPIAALLLVALSAALVAHRVHRRQALDKRVTRAIEGAAVWPHLGALEGGEEIRQGEIQHLRRVTEKSLSQPEIAAAWTESHEGRHQLFIVWIENRPSIDGVRLTAAGVGAREYRFDPAVINAMQREADRDGDLLFSYPILDLGPEGKKIEDAATAEAVLLRSGAPVGTPATVRLNVRHREGS